MKFSQLLAGTVLWGVCFFIKAQSNLDKSLLRIIELTEPSIVNMTFFDNYNEPIGYSSGFFVSSNTVATTAHLAEKSSKIVITTFNNDDFEVLSQIALIPEYDLALFKVGGYYEGRPLPVADEVMTNSQGYLLSTSPINGFIFKVTNCKIGEANIVIGGITFNGFTVIGQNIEANCIPLVNSLGQLIGIVNSYLSKRVEAGYSLALDPKYIRKLQEIADNNPISVTYSKPNVKVQPIIDPTSSNKREDSKTTVQKEPKTVQGSVKSQEARSTIITTTKQQNTPIQSDANYKTLDNANANSTDLQIDRASFEKKALDKVEDFQSYLKIITNKQTHFQDINKSIDLACALFINEGVLVDVSNKQKQSLNSYPIRSYFNRLKQLKYDKIEMEWVNIYYLSNLRKGVDGNYYGVISFDQVFKGIKDGRVIFGDVTRKTIEVVAKVSEKQVSGEISKSWDVFLGDIRVVETW